MAHLHEMRDSDNHFIINKDTMVIENKSKKHTLQQGDHNCEIYTFEIPRIVEGHDMTLCNLVDIHYINIKGDKSEHSKDIHAIKTMSVSEDEPEVLVFTWTIHGNATKYAGSMSFRIRFACIDESGEYTYKKHTEIFKGINISEGLDNTEYVEYEHSDIISQWEARFDALEEPEAPDYAQYFDIDVDGLISLKPDYQNGGSKNAELPEKLVIPDIINETAVTALAPSMFKENKAVKSITIPEYITEIPSAFCDRAYSLEEINGTQNVEVINGVAFQGTSLKKASFPNLKTLNGKSNFARSVYLVHIDIGNNITALPDNIFYLCDKLNSIRGGEKVTTIGNKSLQGTLTLKNLPFAKNLTSIGDYGIDLSRVDYDWLTHTGCTYGNTATWASYNTDPTKWQNDTKTPCVVPIRSTFGQTFVPDGIENATVRDYVDNCLCVIMAWIYSAYEGLDIDSALPFINALMERNPNILAYDPGTNAGVLEYLQTMDYTVEQYHTTADGMQPMYDALAAGHLVLLGTKSRGKTINDVRHGVLVRGVTENGELMMVDPAASCFAFGDRSALHFTAPVQNVTIFSDTYPSGYFVVKKGA